MPVFYLEDVTKCVGNKFLAVNVAAERGHQLVEPGIPILELSSREKLLG